MLGTYWKLGTRKAEAGGASSTAPWGTMDGSLPGAAAGSEPGALVVRVERSLWCEGEVVGGKEELVRRTLW